MTGATPEYERGASRLLGDAAVVLVAAIAIARVVIAWRYKALADGPAFAAITDLGPSALMTCDVVAILALLAAVAAAVVQGRHVHVMLLGLWLVGVIVSAVHVASGGGAAALAGSWIGSLALGVAALHLAADRIRKRLLIGALVGLCVALGLHAAHDYFLQYPATVESYEADPDAMLRQQGWAFGSIEQRKFERRLYQREATGRFGLANVFGTVTGSLTLLGVGLTLAARRSQWLMLLAGAATLLGALALGLSMSKGAIAATGVVAVGAGGAMLLGRGVCAGPWLMRLAALGLVAAAIGAVVVRFAMGIPQTAEAERSLLFRGFYWQGAARMLAEEPITGIGPGAFQEHYALVKNALSPEVVSDAHNVFVTWIASLGIGGIAWSAILLALLWGAAADRARTDDSSAQVERARVLKIAIMTAVLAFGLQYLTQYAELWIDTAAIWLLSAAAVVACMMLAAHASIEAAWLRLGLLAAATMALVHSQIDMGLTHVMSAPLLCVLLGTAASDDKPPAAARPALGRAVLAAALAAALAWPVAAAFSPPYVPAGERAAQRLAAAWSQRDAQGVIDALRAKLAAQPQSAPAHLQAADLAWRLGRRDRARRWYRRALELHEQAYLDPQSRFAPDRIAHIRSRLDP